MIANLELDPSFYRRATLPFVAREREALYAAYREQGYFEEREEGEVAGEAEAAAFPACLRLWECLGRAKHEPCGEFWETSYGESSWRMAVMALCLAPALDRQRLVHLALASSLASIGATNDENTEWGEKVEEVTRELFAMLPAGRAGLLAGRFGEHAEVRRGRLDGSREHTAYRGVLELEEVMLRWEEEVKDGTTKATEVEVLLAKMARVGFPGAEEYRLLGDRCCSSLSSSPSSSSSLSSSSPAPPPPPPPPSSPGRRSAASSPSGCSSASCRSCGAPAGCGAACASQRRWPGTCTGWP